MDAEKLIVAVRSHSEIYDVNHPKHHNKDIKANIWKGIAKELNTTDKKVKAKWQHLRSNYMREKRKLRSRPPGSTAKVTWPYYAPLSFLDSLVPQKKLESVADLNTCNDQGKETHGKNQVKESQQLGRELYAKKDRRVRAFHLNCEDLNGTHANSETAIGRFINSNNVSADLLHSKKRKKNSRPTDEDDIHKLYIKHLDKISSKAEEENDPDLMFLRSLLPSIKRLGPLENLEFKSEVIQLLKQKLMPPLSPDESFSSSSSVGSPYVRYSPPPCEADTIETLD